MQRDKKAIIKKYDKNIKSLIKKYEKYEDDSLEVIDILNFEEHPTFVLDSISFIKNNRQESIFESKLTLFQDVYLMLCTECSFEQIYRILK